MGNTICCEEQPVKTQITNVKIKEIEAPKIQKPADPVEPIIQLPELADPIKQCLIRQKPFEDRMPQNPKTIQYGADFYVGNVDVSNRPTGIGKMYHKNGSFFVGNFMQGVANGDGFYIKKDGSYYRGRMINNVADDQYGYFWSPQFEYRGTVKNNMFHGSATQKGASYQFIGTYEENRKKKGKLIWMQGGTQCSYDGPFNEAGKFEGQGELITGAGKYNGAFRNGKKNGKGIFVYENKMKYIGEYEDDLKQGNGQLIKSNKQLAYEGQFLNDLPHGKGKAVKNGQLTETEWKQGIDIKAL